MTRPDSDWRRATSRRARRDLKAEHAVVASWCLRFGDVWGLGFSDLVFGIFWFRASDFYLGLGYIDSTLQADAWILV